MLKTVIFKRALLVVGLVAMLAPMGCRTTDPVIWSWPHHKRRLRTLLEDLHEMHMDFDRIFFDMEPYPIEVEY